jgi:hypothetical protein
LSQTIFDDVGSANKTKIDQRKLIIPKKLVIMLLFKILMIEFKHYIETIYIGSNNLGFNGERKN